ncbi:hypothetical protein [Sorangium sp. So ce1099]|uniref:hypothetical protein n=1 Tax=Sorangium sp. So ce1099 TaxID=3133331 RepID=UPI003F64427E
MKEKRKVSRAASAPPDRASRCCASARTSSTPSGRSPTPGERADAPIRMARELPGAERAVMLGWALRAAREEYAGGTALAAAAGALDGQARVTTALEAVARLGRERTGASPIARVSLAALLPDAEALDLGRDAFAEVPADARSDELPRLSEAPRDRPTRCCAGSGHRPRRCTPPSGTWSSRASLQVCPRRSGREAPRAQWTAVPRGGRALERDTDCGSEGSLSPPRPMRRLN